MRPFISPPRRNLLLAFSILTLFPPAVSHADVVESRLMVKGRIRDVVPVDLDDDSLKDILVLSVTGHSTRAERRASVFWQHAPRTFRDQPDLVWDLDPSITALDPFSNRAMDWVGIFSLRQDGVHAHRFHRNGRIESEQILEASFPHLVPAEESVTLLDFVAAWRDHEQEVLVPAFPHPLLFRNDGDPVALSSPPVAFYRRTPSALERSATILDASYSFSTPLSVDQDGDDQREIVFVERNRVTVFDSLGRPQGPSKRVYPVRLLTDQEASSDRYTVRSQLVDLDGNGRADLVSFVYRGSAVLQMTGRVMIFRAGPDGSFEPEADQVLQLDDALYNLAQVLDLDGDGAREVVIPTAKIGLWGYLRLLTTRKVSFTFNTLSLGPEGRFDPQRPIRDPMTMRLSQSYDLPVLALVDTCGDGLLDLVIGKGEDQVCIHDNEKHRARRRFTSRPRSCFETDPFDRFLHADLDGDRKEELIRYGVRGEERNVVTVTFLGVCPDPRN